MVNDVLFPKTQEESIERSVKWVLKAANELCITAAAREGEGEDEDAGELVGLAERLRDIATAISPPRPAWPRNGAAIYDLTTRKRIN